MEEIKLWKVSGLESNLVISNITSATHTKTEEMLEEILVKAPDLLFEGLKLVGRQVETSGGATLDLLGVDEDGQLIVFELKRATPWHKS
jgi:RecB family endonuclease NucS